VACSPARNDMICPGGAAASDRGRQPASATGALGQAPRWRALLSHLPGRGAPAWHWRRSVLGGGAVRLDEVSRPGSAADVSAYVANTSSRASSPSPSAVPLERRAARSPPSTSAATPTVGPAESMLGEILTCASSTPSGCPQFLGFAEAGRRLDAVGDLELVVDAGDVVPTVRCERRAGPRCPHCTGLGWRARRSPAPGW